MELSKQAVDFAAFHAEHAEYIRRMLARHGVPTSDLDDVLQEALITIHRLLPSFEGRSSTETWLHSLTWRIAANHHRRVRRRAEATVDPTQVLVDEAALPEEEGARLRRCLIDLDDEQRDLFALHHIGGLSISQLSDLAGSARATIRQRLGRGRAAIGRRLWKALAEPELPGSLERFSVTSARRTNPAGALARPIVHGETTISVLGDVVLVLWSGTSSSAAQEALISTMIAVSDANAQGFRFMSIIDPTSRPPTREERNMMAWAASRLGPNLKAAAWAAEASTLMTLVAPVMNTCMFLGGVPINARFFSAVARATTWLAGYATSDWISPEELAKQVEVMRQCLIDQNGR